MLSILGEHLNHLLTAFLTHFTYLALMLVLVLAGTGMPIPEDIPLIFSGYLCSRQSPIIDLQKMMEAEPTMIDTNGDGIPDAPNPHLHHHIPRVPRLPLMCLAGMIGVLLGDSIVFSIGRRGIDSHNFVARHLRKVLHSKRREKVERHFARHGNLTVFLGRFMPGARSLIFAFAGLSKMSYPNFLLIDGAAAAISVPLFIFLGFHFAYHIQYIINYISRLERVILIPTLLALALIITLIYLLRRRHRAAATTPIDNV